MFSSFFKYIQQNNLLTDAINPALEKYISMRDTFYYIDFDRIQKMCDENYRHICQAYDNNSTTFSSDRFDEIRNKVSLLRELIPFDALLCNKDYSIVLEQIWLKNKKEHLGYLLGGEINIVGRVCKSLQVNDEMPDVIRILNMRERFKFCVNSKN
ncbi:MAG: hypothetical protein NC124_17135 [Clostridium sp.]|nr:hypothetical protein [Clostridium sp.]